MQSSKSKVLALVGAAMALGGMSAIPIALYPRVTEVHVKTEEDYFRIEAARAKRARKELKRQEQRAKSKSHRT